MSLIDSTLPMARRYSRALRFTGPKLAAENPAAAIEGHWLDTSRYYFLAERFEPSIGRMLSTPSIANCDDGSVKPVISLDTLAQLLSARAQHAVDLEALSSAEFRMPQPDRLAVALGGRHYLVDVRALRVVAAETATHVPALFSPDGHYACFVKGHDLWLRDRHTGAERPLTADGERHCCYGQQPETSLSAVTYRKRSHPVGLWSGDSRWFVTHRVDERALPELALLQSVPPGDGRPLVHTYKYPMQGDPLPVATCVAVHVASGRTVSFPDFAVEISAFSPFALCRVWFGAGDTAWFVNVDRYCKRADLVQLDLAKGVGHVVLSEAVKSGYIDLNPLTSRTPNVRIVATSNEVVWFSECDGWGHLYLHDAVTGALKNRITSGAWQVRDVVYVDEARRKLLFLAGGIEAHVDPAWRSLCTVNLDGSGFEVLLTHDGDVSIPVTAACGLGQDFPFRAPLDAQAGVSPDGRFGVVRYASADKGNRTEVVELGTRRSFVLASAVPAADEVSARRFVALAADGVTRLHGVLFLPSDFDESRKYPLIDYVYPGPQVAQQPQFFRSLRAAPAIALAELGFVTVMLDTRGTPLGSRAFRHASYGALLEPQLADHAAVVRQLCRRHRCIDADRVGIFGQSGGGTAAARALCDYGDLFKVGVAVCGNHDSRFYAAAWSDKYLGSHGAAPDHANGAVAQKLQGHLLLVSGDMDENVHVGQTLSLVDALIRANKDFDLLIVPNAGHDVLITCGYAERRMWDFFVRHLLGETPPNQFELSFQPHELARFKRNRARELQH